MNLSLKDIVALLNPEVQADDRRVAGISIDTRTLVSGDVFFALKGQVDGHQFVRQAFEKGACAVVVDQSCDIEKEYVQIQVDDTLKALQKLAANYRDKIQVPVIAITGTNGKTTTKEMLYQILSMQYVTEKTYGNFNNHIGLPLSLLKWGSNIEVGVLEMGTNHFGEIAALCEIAKPTHGVITNIGEGHLEFLKDKAGVSRAKGELLDSLPGKGLAFLNGDDPYLLKMKDKVDQTILFGFSDRCQIQGYDLISDLNSVSFKIEGHEIVIPSAGKHNAYNALAAIGVALALNVSWQNIKDGFAHFQPVDQRFQAININGVTFFNDAYNANPSSVESAILTLEAIETVGRKIVVMGDMLELGSQSQVAHKKMGALMAAHQIHALFGLGKETQLTVQAAESDVLKFAAHFDSHERLAGALKDFIQPGDVVLVKGSRGMKMENIIDLFNQPNEKVEG